MSLSLCCRGRIIELAALQTIDGTQMIVPITLLLQSAPAMLLQQLMWLLHFCATCGQHTGDEKRGRAPGARRGLVPLDGMRGVSGRGDVCVSAGPGARARQQRYHHLLTHAFNACETYVPFIKQRANILPRI